MPQNVIETSEFTGTITAPSDGDARNAASVLGPLRALTNRTRYLLNRILGGIPRIQFFGDLAGLQNVPTSESLHGNIAVALDAMGRTGIYVYRTDFSGPNAHPYIVKPAGVADGTAGRWVHYLASYGLSEVVDENNVWPFPTAGRITAQAFDEPIDKDLTDDSSERAIFLGSTFQVKGLVDRIHANFTGCVKATDITNPATIRFYVRKPSGSDVQMDGGRMVADFPGVNKRMPFSIQGYYEPEETGLYRLYATALVPIGAGTYHHVFSTMSARAWVVRP